MNNSRRNSLTKTSTSWSVYTPYTALTGLHSEVDPAATARSNLIQSTISDAMTTTQSIHKKDLQTMAYRRKSVENSMQSYSEKMKYIADRRHTQTQYTENGQQQLHASHTTKDTLTRKFSMTGTRQEVFGKSAVLPPIGSPRRILDAEKLHTSELNNHDSKLEVVGSPSQSDHFAVSRRVRRFGVYEKPEISDECDKEIEALSERPDQNISIAPFPERSKSYVKNFRDQSPGADLIHRETPTPFIKSDYFSYRLIRYPKKQLLAVDHKPSPMRRSKRGSRPYFKALTKPYHQVFTYSSAIQSAILGLDDDPDLVIDKKKNIYKSKVDLESINVEELRHTQSLRPIHEVAEPEPLHIL